MCLCCRNAGPDAAAQYERIRSATESILGRSQVGTASDYRALLLPCLDFSELTASMLQPAQTSEASAAAKSAAARWRPETLTRCVLAGLRAFFSLAPVPRRNPGRVQEPALCTVFQRALRPRRLRDFCGRAPRAPGPVRVPRLPGAC